MNCYVIVCPLQQIMKDRWINAGFEEDELKPFVEPELDISDQKRIGTTPSTKNLSGSTHDLNNNLSITVVLKPRSGTRIVCDP